MKTPRVFLVAGEPSGDSLGGGLIAALKQMAPDTMCAGVGGPEMFAAGMYLVFPYDDLAVMGLVEVLPRYFRIRRRWREVMAAIERFDPDVVVTIDSGGFNKPVARKLIARGSTARRVQYVGPMVWAWRPGRAKTTAELFHRLLVLFPFEPPFFEAHGLPTTWVGHPAAERPPGNGPRFRAAHGISSGAKVVAVLPGSRPGEVGRLLPSFTQALGMLAERIRDLILVFPTLPLVAEQVRAAVDRLSIRAVVSDRADEKADAFAASDAAMAASGTVTLELALARVPMVVAYRVNPVTAFLGRRLLNVSSASLPNLLAGSTLVSECLQDDCRPDILAVELARLFDSPEARNRQIEAFHSITADLRSLDGSPSEAAAAMILHEAAERRSADKTTPTA